MWTHEDGENSLHVETVVYLLYRPRYRAKILTKASVKYEISDPNHVIHKLSLNGQELLIQSPKLLQ